MDLQGEKAKLDAYENAMKTYQDPNLAQNVGKYVQEAYTPVIQSASDSIRNQMANYLPRYFNVTNQGLAAGTDAASLTPQQKLALASGELGLMSGNLASANALVQGLGGSLNQMRDTALGNLRDARGTAENAWNRQFQVYQLAFQQEEARKAREAQERMAAAARAASRAPSVNPIQFNPFQAAPTSVRNAIQSRDPNALYNAMKAWEQSSGGYNPDQHEMGWYAWREMQYGQGAGDAGQAAIDSGQWNR